MTPWDPNTLPFEAGMIAEIRLKNFYQREAKTPFSKILCVCELLSPWRHNGHDHRVRQIWLVHLSLLGNSVVVVVVRTRARAIPLAMITMRKSTHGFPFHSHDAYGAPLGSPSGRRSSAIKQPVKLTSVLLRWLRLELLKANLRVPACKNHKVLIFAARVANSIEKDYNF